MPTKLLKYFDEYIKGDGCTHKGLFDVDGVKLVIEVMAHDDRSLSGDWWIFASADGKITKKKVMEIANGYGFSWGNFPEPKQDATETKRYDLDFDLPGQYLIDKKFRS